jgi:RNA polymerase sigma-70 factor (ECF subfamily)
MAARGVTTAHRFARARPRLLRLAYSQLGDLVEAEDVVQEAWLRLERTDAEAIRDLDAWLTTVVGRLALDTLRSARVRREAYVGPWLPEPLETAGAEDPADRVTLDESVSYALLTLLEQLSPAERTAAMSRSGAPGSRPRATSTIAPCARSRRPSPRATSTA